MRAFFTIFITFFLISPAFALTEAEFGRVLESLEKNRKTGVVYHPYAQADRYNQIIDDNNKTIEFTQNQRAELIYKRGVLRATQAHDKLGAAADYKTIMDGFSASPLAARAEKNYAYVQGQLYHMLGRVISANGPNHMTVKGLWDLGYWGLAAGIEQTVDYSKVGASHLSSVYVTAMHEVGFLCEEKDLTVTARYSYGHKESLRHFNYCPEGTPINYPQPQSFTQEDRLAELKTLRDTAYAAMKKD